MSAKLFEPITIGGVEFRNRIAMSPMCMHSAGEDGRITNFHIVHYGARALGGAGLVFLETTAVMDNGLIGPGDIGIWSDDHVEGLAELTSSIQSFGAKAGCQLGHAGRQLGVPGRPAIAPSAIPFTPESPVPQALDITGIKAVVEAFRQGARRAREAGFDVVEIHTAHGYLLNEFLSPLANTRDDEYGGNHENRYRIVREVIDAVKSEWSGPLFVRISSTDYTEGGNTPEDFITYGQWMKDQGVDLIDCSSGGIAMVKVQTYPAYRLDAPLFQQRFGFGTVDAAEQLEGHVKVAVTEHGDSHFANAFAVDGGCLERLNQTHRNLSWLNGLSRDERLMT